MGTDANPALRRGNLLQASELYKLEWSRYIAGLLCSRMGSLQEFTEQTEKGNGVVFICPRAHTIALCSPESV